MTKVAKEFGEQLINFQSNVSASNYMIALFGSMDIHSNPNEFSDYGENHGNLRVFAGE